MAQEEFLDNQMADVIEQWGFYFSVLNPQAGDLILDIGCNTGEAERLLLREYPSIGKMVGVENDPRRYEYALSKWHKDGSPEQIELRLSDALNLPFLDAHFDRAFCVDTLEWVKEPVKALQEIHRVVKSESPAVIVHSDFDTQVFHCEDNELCRRIVHAFSDSGPNGQLGRKLYRLCKTVAFQTIRPLVYTLINTEWLPNLYGYKVAHMMADWLTKTKRVTGDELARWLADLEAQSSQGCFFYSINRYICVCVK